MPRTHVVVQGECLNSIARRYGFADYRTIYNDPGNKVLRKKRPSPDLLCPGDEIVIPDRKTKTVACATGVDHQFVVTLPRRKLRIVLQDVSGEALAHMPYRLTLGQLEIEGKTDGNGLLEKDIPAGARKVTLHMGSMTQELLVGHLDPVKEVQDGGVSGAQARLHNLGYAPGPADGVCRPRTTTAIEAFQRDHKLEPTGKIDDALLVALEKTHGC